MTTATLNRRGPRPITIDLDRVADLVGRGATNIQVAAALGISIRTLYDRIRDSEPLRLAIVDGRRREADFTRSVLQQRAAAGSWPAIRALMALHAGFLVDGLELRHPAVNLIFETVHEHHLAESTQRSAGSRF